MFLENLRYFGSKDLPSRFYRLQDGKFIIDGKKFYLLNVFDKANLYVNKNSKVERGSSIIAVRNSKQLVFDKTDISYLGKKVQANSIPDKLISVKKIALSNRQPMDVGYLTAFTNGRMTSDKFLGQRGKLGFALGKRFFISNRKSLLLQHKVPYFVLQRYLIFSRMLKYLVKLYRGLFFVNKFNLKRNFFLKWLRIPFFFWSYSKGIIKFLKFIATESFYRRKFKLYRRLLVLGGLLYRRIFFMLNNLFVFYKPFIYYYKFSKGLLHHKNYGAKFIAYMYKKYRNFRRTWNLIFINNKFVSKLSNSLYVLNKLNLLDALRRIKLLRYNLVKFRLTHSALNFSERSYYFLQKRRFKGLYFKFLKNVMLLYYFSYVKKFKRNFLELKSIKLGIRKMVNGRRSSFNSIVSFTRNFDINLLRSFSVRYYNLKGPNVLRYKQVMTTLQAMHRFNNIGFKKISRLLILKLSVSRLRRIMKLPIRAALLRLRARKRFLFFRRRKFLATSAVMGFNQGISGKVHGYRKGQGKGKFFFKNATIR